MHRCWTSYLTFYEYICKMSSQLILSGFWEAMESNVPHDTKSSRTQTDLWAIAWQRVPARKLGLLLQSGFPGELGRHAYDITLQVHYLSQTEWVWVRQKQKIKWYQMNLIPTSSEVTRKQVRLLNWSYFFRLRMVCWLSFCQEFS